MDRSFRLRALLKDMGSVLVAFSAGVDSTFLAAVAARTLGRRAVAATAASPFVPGDTVKKARRLSQALKIRHFVVRFDPPAACWKNKADRCYVCKKALFMRLAAEAKARGLRYVVDGSTRDDLRDFRPGSWALRDLKIVSPLQLAGFTKDDIRRASRALGLPTWNRESAPCLATRVPYGRAITPAAISMIEGAEAYLRRLGFRSVRVRYDGCACRIEVSPLQVPALIKKRKNIARRLAALGFTYVAADLSGYRCGAMNEVFAWTKKRSSAC